MAAAVDGAVQQRRRAPPTAKGGGVQATGGRLNHHPLPPFARGVLPGVVVGSWPDRHVAPRAEEAAQRRLGDKEERRRRRRG